MTWSELDFPVAGRQHPFQDENISTISSKMLDLGLLGFSGPSLERVTAEEVRRHAISLRIKAQKGGIDTQTQAALRWALTKTKDCLDDQEFNSFLLDGCDFNVILSRRLLKRTTS